MKGTFSASQTASRRTHAVDSTRNTTRKSRSRNSSKKRTSRKNAPPVPYAHSARVPAVRCGGERNLTGEKKAWCADSFRIGKRVGQKYLAMFPGLTTRGGSRRTFLETVVVKSHQGIRGDSRVPNERSGVGFRFGFRKGRPPATSTRRKSQHSARGPTFPSQHAIFVARVRTRARARARHLR